MKNQMMLYMRKMMLTCEEATYLSTKDIVAGVSLKDKINLFMHKLFCIHCRRYFNQIKNLTRIIRYNDTQLTDNETTCHRLSHAEKLKLQKAVKEKIKSV